MCRRLRELDLLHDMRFDATLPDGSKLGVDGFLTVDEKKLGALDDAVVVEAPQERAARADRSTPTSSPWATCGGCSNMGTSAVSLPSGAVASM